MLLFACDLCERPIKETGYQCDMVETRLIYGESPHPHMAERGQILSLYVCAHCASRVQRTIHTIRAQSEAANKKSTEQIAS